MQKTVSDLDSWSRKEALRAEEHFFFHWMNFYRSINWATDTY